MFHNLPSTYDPLEQVALHSATVIVSHRPFSRCLHHAYFMNSTRRAMRGSQLLLRPATKPSLQALAQAPIRNASAAVFLSNHHIDLGDIVPPPTQRHLLGLTCLSHQRMKNTNVANGTTWAFPAADRHGLLLSDREREASPQ